METPKGTIRIKKPKYTSQDVRTKAIEARDELVANLDFLMDCIREDRVKLQAYKEQFGDLNYRPIIRPATDSTPAEYGSPSVTLLEPLASSMRMAITAILNSIRVIQDEILPEDDPEGASGEAQERSEGSTQRRKSLRETFQSEASVARPAIPPTEPDQDEEAKSPTQLVESKPQTRIQPRPAQDKTSPAAEPKPMHSLVPRPWRETTPKAQSTFVPKSVATPPIQAPQSNTNPNNPIPVVNEPKQERSDKSSNGVVGLSPALRMQMQLGGNKLDSIRDKYRSGESRSVKRSSEDGDDID